MDSDAIHRRTIAKTTFTLTLPLAFSLLTYFFLGRWIYSEFLFFGTYSTRAVDVPNINVFPESEEVVVLKNTLRKAAMEEDNKTIILTTLNAAWTDKGSIFDLFLEGFKSGIGTQQLLNHVVVLAVDPTAYNRCMEAHLHCYALKTQGVDFSGHKNFMTPDYIKLMWRRLEFSIQVLQLGFHFIFTVMLQLLHFHV
ncbi:hypothetical protein M569_13943 [Genlisea aurea]|uniref:Nucleotide-diphospho-sugar transferase domain-containing protein n=1 Tax=Genlisea aurea TaxID=192259 RepID=S8DDQ3_9LAMI|nr:hypothetical protein M569_13943 [Genlisea aurea]